MLRIALRYLFLFRQEKVTEKKPSAHAGCEVASLR